MCLCWTRERGREGERERGREGERERGREGERERGREGLCVRVNFNFVRTEMMVIVAVSQFLQVVISISRHEPSLEQPRDVS